MWVTSNHKHHQCSRYMLIKNFSEIINKAYTSERNSQEYSNIFVGEKKNGRQTMRPNETVNPYINKTALTSLQDFWCRQDEEPPYVLR